MCTVTFVPQGANKFILTSNRDEAPDRKTIAPQKYLVGDTELVYPKDAVAGGTWIGFSDKDRLICLLNGGFTKHERQESYRMSRGIIVTDILTSVDAIATIEAYDFNEIEPFTIVMVQWHNELQLHELVWDGTNAHFNEKPLAPHIWSSSLLYSQDVKAKREQWFSQFLMKQAKPSKEQLLDFHLTGGEGNSETDLVMDRGFVKTKSTTQVVNMDDTVMRHNDILLNNITETTL